MSLTEMRYIGRRPILSAKKDIPMLVTRENDFMPPLMPSWVLELVIPISFMIWKVLEKSAESWQRVHSRWSSSKR